MPSARKENRQAIIRLNPPMLEQLLSLPDGYEIERIHAHFDPMSIVVVVSSMELDAQPPDTYLPDLAGQVTHDCIIDRDGKRYQRWGWQR